MLFILAFIFVQGIGVLISYEIANDGDSVIHCDNGKTFPSPTSYLDSSEKLEIYKKCDLASFLLTKSDVPGTLTKDQIDDVRERVTEMQNNNELQSDIQTAVNEFKQIYNLDVVVLPTNRPLRRKNYSDCIYKTRREKYNAVVDEISDCHGCGQPVLVGTI